MKFKDLIPVFALSALVLLAIAAVKEESGTVVHYRQRAVLTFDSQVTVRDEDNAWTFNAANMATLTNGNPSGAWTSLVIAGTTNQIKFGSTNTAPASTNLVLWVSVQVSGDTNIYRLGLAK